MLVRMRRAQLSLMRRDALYEMEWARRRARQTHDPIWIHLAEFYFKYSRHLTKRIRQSESVR